MGNDVNTRVLLLIVAVLTAGLTAVGVGWITWANERNAGRPSSPQVPRLVVRWA
ncbi:hypothetical protein ACFYL6_20135 [Micromonospora sp. NPDC007208]|uniref:hypothetical protein n=1 Tax=Micromonospora sp. NPDC007208 TaxID=3364236 RepID=UPI0036B229D3